MVLNLPFSSIAQTRLRWWLLFLLPLWPLVNLLWLGFSNDLGTDPAKFIVDEMGTWAINFLWITLAITPVRQTFGWGWALKFRRMMGLYALLYAVLHLLAFATFLIGWRLDLFFRELTERPYIVVGALALLILIPMGITSTKAMMRKLGKRWKMLHRWIYPASLLVMLHFIWQIRASFYEQLVYGLILAVLLGHRLYQKYK